MCRLPTTLCALILLSGCSADWHLKRAISKDPSILLEGRTVIHDTLTVVTPEIVVDTVHHFSRDTVTTYVDRVRIRTKVDTVARTVYVDVICPPDTVRVAYDRVIIQPQVCQPQRYHWVWVGLLLVLAIALYLHLYKG